MDTRTRLSWLIFGMTNAVLFGMGLVPVLTIKPWSEHAAILIPLVVLASFVLAFPIAWWLVPWMRARYERRRSLMQ
ncbi:hypothetical protein [Bradyrhizobium sp. G127]|jgi:hypothetical protein|uniref:hypothetical protein n=1 Tax=Bradyrhizobium sp. G127 TaxID=2904800 RepID=UPI001F2544AB|nr:hypothetical protein [Bradyrhizobium sp. G127]MCF2523582.1 hypothetical protein [Bradyrhizobium sp. G127]